MSDPNSTETTTESILKELLQSVLSLQKEVTELKKDREKDMMAATNRSYPQKRPCDGNEGIEGDTGITCNCEDNLSERESDSDALEDDLGGEKHKSSGSYKVSEEGEAFLETVFTSKLRYQARQAKVE